MADALAKQLKSISTKIDKLVERLETVERKVDDVLKTNSAGDIETIILKEAEEIKHRLDKIEGDKRTTTSRSTTRVSGKTSTKPYPMHFKELYLQDPEGTIAKFNIPKDVVDAATKEVAEQHFADEDARRQKLQYTILAHVRTIPDLEEKKRIQDAIREDVISSANAVRDQLSPEPNTPEKAS